MATTEPFSLASSGTSSNSGPITVTTISAATLLPKAGGDQIMITNETAQTIYAAQGNANAIATTGSTPVPQGQYTFSIAPDSTHIALYTASGTATAHITIGQGQ